MRLPSSEFNQLLDAVFLDARSITSTLSEMNGRISHPISVEIVSDRNNIPSEALLYFFNLILYFLWIIKRDG